MLLRLLTFVLLAAPAFAQFETAEVLGTVRDTSQKAIAQASVTLLNEETGVQSKTTSGADGNFDFFNVKVGRYSITVEAPGFSKYSSRDIAVNVNARQRVDVTLQVGAVSETVGFVRSTSVDQLRTTRPERASAPATAIRYVTPLDALNKTLLAEPSP